MRTSIVCLYLVSRGGQLILDLCFFSHQSYYIQYYICLNYLLDVINNHMANVHGFRDLNNQPRGGNRNGNQNNRAAAQNLEIQANKILFMNPGQNDRPPQDQSIPYTLKLFCCPNFSFISITTVMVILIWGLYITCCIVGIDKNPQTYSVLEIKQSVLIDFGAAQDLLVKKGQVYRLVSAAFLHWNLMHIVTNTISMFIILTRLEDIYPYYYIIGLLLTSAITGNISSVLYNKDGTVIAGVSVMLFGILGAFIGYMAINWQYLARYPALRSQTCCIVSFICIFSILFSFGPHVDFYGHFTGMLGGFLFSIGVFPGLTEKSKIYMACGLGALLAYNLTVFLVFYLTK